MRIAIESTDEILENYGRIWNGITEAGIPCVVFVMGVGHSDPQIHALLQVELATLGNRQAGAVIGMVSEEQILDPEAKA